MIDHIPECPCVNKSAHPDGCLCCEISSPCICSALRACEQRVREEERQKNKIYARLSVHRREQINILKARLIKANETIKALKDREKIVEQIRAEERNRSDLYMQGYADGRSDAKELSEINATFYYNYGYDDGYTAAKRDAVEAVTNAGIGNDSKYQKEIDMFAIQSLGEER